MVFKIGQVSKALAAVDGLEFRMPSPLRPAYLRVLGDPDRRALVMPCRINI